MPATPKPTLPRITLVTPSFNQAAFLERTIRSVLQQGYPNLEYGIVDGGSTDGSRWIIRQYRRHLDFAIIEPDRGQSDAINKGLRRATGDVVAWLNSDDELQAETLWSVGRHFARHGDCRWLLGHGIETDAEGRPLRDLKAEGDFTLRGALLREQTFNIVQPAAFWRRELHDRLGYLDTDLHFCMDFDLWCRFLADGVRPQVIHEPLATYRLHDASKTVAQRVGFHNALLDVERRYAPKLHFSDRLKLYRLISYQMRLNTLNGNGGRPWKAVLRRPWWLASSDVRQALLRGAA